MLYSKKLVMSADVFQMAIFPPIKQITMMIRF